MYFASTSVLSHLTVIAWERYMAIKKWRKYKLIATKRLAKKLALLAWLPAMCVAPPYILAGAKIDVGWFEKFYLSFQGVFWGSAVIVTVYFYLMVHLRIRKLQIYRLDPSCALPMGKHKIRIAKTTGFITVIIILLFLLPVALEILGKFSAIFQQSSVFHLTETIMQLNSLANPLIYCYRDRRFRGAIFEMLRLKESEKNQPAYGAAPELVGEIKPERHRSVEMYELPPQNTRT